MTILTDSQNKPLFIDLTSQEAALIEGGAVFLSHIQALKLTKDERDKRDEPYLLVNGRKIWKAKRGMKVGDIQKIGKFAFYPRMLGGVPNIQLWEDDGLGKRSDDFIGRLGVTNPILRRRRVEILRGSGAVYRLFYFV
ncbi:MAG: hypothetical protein WBB01_03355 [Phormidesmis sp.]